MHPASSIVGKPVVTAAEGNRIGEVSDLLIDPAEGMVVGLVVADGWRKDERVLPFRDVRTLGGDAVIVASSSAILDRASWRRTGQHVIRTSDLSGRPVLTSAGSRLGTIKDVLIDDTSGTVDHMVVQSPRLGGLLHRSSTFAVSKDVRVGADAVVIPAGALSQPGHR